MSIRGTAAHRAKSNLPPLVKKAVDLATSLGFENSCLPGHGQLLAVLAAGRSGGLVGETGTGCGVGLAWMVSAATADTRFISVELDPERAEAARELFVGSPQVSIIQGDWQELESHGPFDLLVLDGGGAGKRGDSRIDVNRWLSPAGALVIDDFTPMTNWPPTHDGTQDEARMHWLKHPALFSTEIRISPDWSTLVAIRQ